MFIKISNTLVNPDHIAYVEQITGGSTNQIAIHLAIPAVQTIAGAMVTGHSTLYVFGEEATRAWDLLSPVCKSLVSIQRADGTWEDAARIDLDTLPVGTVYRGINNQKFRVEQPGCNEKGVLLFSASAIR